MSAVASVAATGAAPVPAFKKPTLRMVLRSATAVDHEAVDVAFGAFDLTSAISYRQFLIAHAQVLCPMERAIAGLWPLWRARFPLIKADLAELGVDVPIAATPTMLSDGESWGVLYVLEGSRLGGGIVAGRVASGLPVRYLSATHEDGNWQRFGKALEQAGDAQGAQWNVAAISGAKSVFARFAEAAAEARS